MRYAHPPPRLIPARGTDFFAELHPYQLIVLTMTEKKILHTNGSPGEKIQAVRALVVGPQMRALEIKLENLSRQVEQLQAHNQNARADYAKKLEQARTDFELRMERMVRRAARHRARTTLRLKHMAQELQKIAKQFTAEHESRTALAKTMSALARQLRTLPPPPRLELSTLDHKPKTKRKKIKPDSNDAAQS